MNNYSKPEKSPWKLPLLAIIAVLVVLSMLRLGVWQLARADQKQAIVDQLSTRSQLPALFEEGVFKPQDSNALRFRMVTLSGHYDASKTVYVDNQVVNGQVGYQVFTPFIVDNSEIAVMVARGFVAVGDSRDILPTVHTTQKNIQIEGRLNRLPAKPPMWSDEYPIFEGARWQFLPISDLAKQLHLDLFPLVVELPPNKAKESAITNDLVRQWSVIDDQWVAKHKGYAFQWFAMAAAFFIACLVLLLRTLSTKN